MIEAYENEKYGAETASTGGHMDGARAGLTGPRASLDKYNLAEMLCIERRDEPSELQPGRKPLTTSSILSKFYSRAFTHYRPWPPMTLTKPMQYEVENLFTFNHHPRRG